MKSVMSSVAAFARAVRSAASAYSSGSICSMAPVTAAEGILFAARAARILIRPHAEKRTLSLVKLRANRTASTKPRSRNSPSTHSTSDAPIPLAASLRAISPSHCSERAQRPAILSNASSRVSGFLFPIVISQGIECHRGGGGHIERVNPMAHGDPHRDVGLGNPLPAQSVSLRTHHEGNPFDLL